MNSGLPHRRASRVDMQRILIQPFRLRRLLRWIGALSTHQLRKPGTRANRRRLHRRCLHWHLLPISVLDRPHRCQSLL